jgi:hypothetical protein
MLIFDFPKQKFADSSVKNWFRDYNRCHIYVYDLINTLVYSFKDV